MINWEKYRALYPVTQKKSYFMTAGAGAISQPVLSAIQDRYQIVAENGGRVFGENIAIMESCREKIAQLINADKDYIAFVPNVSFAMNALAQSLPKQGSILLAKNDFPSSVLPWTNAQHSIQWVDTAADLAHELPVDPEQPIASLVCSFVHFANGYRTSLAQIKQKHPQIDMIVNGTQGIGAFPIDVVEQKIDALICSCYKWMGCGEGIAFMYIHPQLFSKLNPALVGWRSVQSAMSFDGQAKFYSSARIFELGWDNMTIFAGFEAALNLISEIGVTNIAKRIDYLTDYLINQLRSINIPIISNTDEQYRSGILLLGPFTDLSSITSHLEQNNIWVTQRDNGIRVALHYFNNEEDIDHLVHALHLL